MFVDDCTEMVYASERMSIIGWYIGLRDVYDVLEIIQINQTTHGRKKTILIHLRVRVSFYLRASRGH